MGSLLTFVLPDGSTALVSEEEAKRLADRLWDAALEPGAPTAAARIVETLRASRALKTRIEFEPRELTALLRLTEGAVDWQPPA
jgi:hypothetical protein